jgi:hypothetical protein
MEMYKALLAGVPYPPPGVEDTPENKATWQRLAQELEDMPAGQTPEIPAEWVDIPD